MHRSTIGLAIGTALLCATSLLSAGSAGAATVTSTHVSAARPVTTTGHAAPGYRIRTIKDAGPVDCSFPDSSPAAVDKNIVSCSPSAAYAVACWPAATPHYVLCLMGGTSKVLTRYKATGTIAHTTAPHPAAPLTMSLSDGTVCGIRDGGAGVNLKQHPTWGATYYCTGDLAVWAPETSTSYGINRAHAAWTVQVASDTGTKPVHTLKVAHAWLVGTHS